jgi:tetratricopeptide (TPR) repeat protein
VVVVALYGILRTLAVGHGSRYDYLAGGDLLLTWGSALRARVFELGQVLRPSFLAPSYLGVPLMDGWADTAFWLACVAVAGCAWIAWRCRRAAPTVTAGIGWWVLFLLPTSQLIPLNMLMGNRWLYAPFIGLAAIVAATVAAAQRRWGGRGRLALVGAGCAWLLLCAAQTRSRAAEWADPVALWSAAATAWPEDPANHAGLAACLVNRADRLEGHDPAAAEGLRRRAVDAVFGLADWRPHSEVLTHAAATLAGAGRPMVARRLLERSWAGAEVPSFETTLRLALVRWETGDRAGAEQLFDTLTAPEQPAAVTVDRVRQGEVFYAGRAHNAGDGRRARAVVWLERARLEFVEGRLDRADHAARAAAREWPESQMAVWARATLLRHAGQADMAGKAVDTIWRQAEIQPIYELRADLAALKGWPKAALQSRARAAARWPFAPELWRALGRHYEGLGEFGVARACFARRVDVAR